MNRNKLTREEEPAFDLFLKKYYNQTLELCWDIARVHSWEATETGTIALALFDKIASPAIYLLDKFRDQLLEQPVSEETKALAKKALEGVS